MDIRKNERGHSRTPKFDLVVGPAGVADFLRNRRETLEGIRLRRLERFAKENGRVALSQRDNKNPETHEIVDDLH